MALRTESLVLSCIGFSRKGSSLKSILSSCEYLNRGVLDRNTLQENLNLLLANGFISIKDNRYYTTEKAKQFYKIHHLEGEGCIAEWIRLSELLTMELKITELAEKICITEDDYQNVLK